MPKKQRGNSRLSRNAVPAGNELLEIFDRQARPLRLDALLRVARIPRHGKKRLKVELAALAREGKLLHLAGGIWARPENLQNVTGRYRALRGGGGFVSLLRADGATAGPELFIHPTQRGGAWHGDLVCAVVMPRRGDYGRDEACSPEGRVTDILERVHKEVPVHLVRRTGDTLFCRPVDSRIPVNFSVRLAKTSVGQSRDNVGDRPPEPGALLLVVPEAELASDLWSALLVGSYGREDDVAVQEELVKLNHEAPREFPPAVLAEVARLPAEPDPEDFAGREDVRSLPLVTIDGEDARDFDDAVHVEKHGSGWLLRVAIADVSHYVRPGRGTAGALDAEALARGNSWYFPRSVEPMLPPALSNNLCSLRPEEDRLAVMVELPLDEKGHPGDPCFASVVMRSAARLTYDAVRDAVLNRDATTRNKLRQTPRGDEVLAMLDEAFALYRILRAERLNRGSLDFDLPEARYEFGRDGRVIGMGVAERHDAHRLIEEFMIAANEAVARWLGAKNSLEFISRVHPEPAVERLEALFTALEATALEPPRLRVNGRPNAGAVREILARAQGTPQEFVVNRLCLRALPQARYQTENIGHFGLASRAYCHFTSPIRRYADLLVHRVLKVALGQPCGEIPAGQRLLRIADQLNRRERAAMDCEREMTRRLACLSLAGREGERFSGVISGVTPFGIFVELEGMPVEGMSRLEDLTDDWYVFDPDRICLTGERHGRVWALGAPVQARLETVDMGRLEIHLLLLSRAPQSAAMHKGALRRGASRNSPLPPRRPGGRRMQRTSSGGGWKSRSGSRTESVGQSPGKPRRRDRTSRTGSPGRRGRSR